MAVETSQNGIDDIQVLRWFCVRTTPKREHIAAAHLRREAGIEVFLPRIRFRRLTRRGPVWFTEALFPGYAFSRFDLKQSLRHILHLPGVMGVVHFGDKWPAVGDEVIADLKTSLGETELHVIPALPDVGESVRLTPPQFQNLSGLVSEVLPAKARVKVLLEFLGRQTTVELPVEHVVRESNPRQSI